MCVCYGSEVLLVESLNTASRSDFCQRGFEVWGRSCQLTNVNMIVATRCCHGIEAYGDEVLYIVSKAQAIERTEEQVVDWLEIEVFRR